MRRMIPLISLFIFALASSSQLMAADVKTWLKSKYKVKAVISGDKVAIDYNGINLVVKLVCIDPIHRDKAKDYLKNLISKKMITIVPEELAELTAEGYQQVYAFFKLGKDRIFINERMLESETCKFVDTSTLDFKQFTKVLRQASQRHKVVTEKIDRVETDGFCSELHSRKYHKASCKWAKYMNDQSRIMYDSMTSAERAKKSPCFHCLYDRVKELRIKKSRTKKSNEGTSKLMADLKGYLYGHKNDNTFYSPVSKKLAKLSQSGLVEYSSLKEARASGRKPDLGSLRINNPVVPKPSGKECIGRALPYMRPCRRESSHPTGLCEPCLNGRIR